MGRGTPEGFRERRGLTCEQGPTSPKGTPSAQNKSIIYGTPFFGAGAKVKVRTFTSVAGLLGKPNNLLGKPNTLVTLRDCRPPRVLCYSCVTNGRRSCKVSNNSVPLY